MTLISAVINFHSRSFIMENQLVSDDYETSFLSEWQTAQEDLDFLDYTYCFEVETPSPPNKGSLSPLSSNDGSKQTTEILLGDEKQTIINVSLDKLRRIEDPESCLRRSVLINNTLKCIKSGLLTQDSASCFAYSSPCKRRRLEDTPVNTTTDCLKDFCFDYEEIVMGKTDNNDKETADKQTDKANNSSLCATEVNNTTRQNNEETKRNCDTVRFAELEFPNVACALET